MPLLNSNLTKKYKHKVQKYLSNKWKTMRQPR